MNINTTELGKWQRADDMNPASVCCTFQCATAQFTQTACLQNIDDKTIFTTQYTISQHSSFLSTKKL